MKANAPEKLYLLSNGLISYCRNTDEDVEYTRTDAFIEKAAKWIEEHEGMYEAFDADSRTYYSDTESMIKDFKKAMRQ